MRSATELILLASLACFASADYEGYQVWRIKPTTENQMRWLSYVEENMADEFDFWTGISRIPGHPVDIMVRPNGRGTLRMLLKQQKMDFEIMIDEVNKLVSNQMAEILARRRGEHSIGARLDNFDYNVYHTYDEIQQWVADMASENSDIIEPFLLGKSYEGREINGFRIRGTGSQSANPPGVWFEGGIHAREWVSPSTVMGFTQKLIDQYRLNEDLAVRMFDNIDWYIVPSLNADGYSYTWTNDRLWRKTRSPNAGAACTGTDPNRNWPYQWGGVGTSPWPCSDIYHGSEALSEVEVANVVAFLRKKKAEGQDFMVFIDWHSYSQVIISPWSYLDSDPRTEDYDDQMTMAIAMSDAILATSQKVYGYGAGAEILYPAAGSSKDWGYASFLENRGDTVGGLGAKYSYTVELRDTGEYGFLLPEDQIQDTYDEIHAAVRAIGTHVLNELGL
ncbi:carboxypeptidase B [Strongylocentrotus purpuratus]|uniref:Peptidase M14 domain-containing protein n=1 Tax=Strongylocentrotus purpuratus TaxID=7668 RepID=A0A7M7HD70_STRPU|nr:carboxypeptidase B [Strongylocentrotus purpuratus]